MAGRSFIVALLCAVLSACASVQPAQRVAVDYNRAFAQSRDEILLLNILRAAGREPLQFSTMGSVTGSSTRGQASLTLPFANLIAGSGADPVSISPSIGLSDSNPTLSIIPLSSAEFTQGILRPTSPQTLSFFLSQGWDAEFLLPMVIGGVRCPSGTELAGRRVMNTGDFTEPVYGRFQAMFAEAAPRLSIDSNDSADASKLWVLVLPGEDAAALIRSGPGEGRRIKSVTTQQDGKARVEIIATEWTVSGMALGRVCNPGQLQPAGVAPVDRVGAAVLEGSSALELNPRSAEPGVFFRSVEAMIYFLGESHRTRLPSELDRCRRAVSPDAERTHVPTYTASGETKELLRITVSCGQNGTPLHRAVGTSLNGRHYFIDALSGPQDPDRSLKTLSFLSELIALQTSQTLIENSAPILAIQR